MVKVKICLLLLCLGYGSLFGGTSHCLKDTYSSQIGVTESGGNNQGEEIANYLAVTGFDYPVPWCASFVAWTFRQCGIETVESAWSPAWFPGIKVINPDRTLPRSGDVFGIYFKSKSRIAHVGFIDDWPPGDYFVTVEGNTNTYGSRDGDGVHRKRRLKKQAYKISRWLNC